MLNLKPCTPEVFVCSFHWGQDPPVIVPLFQNSLNSFESKKKKKFKMLHDLEKFYTKIHCEKGNFTGTFLKIYLTLAMEKLRLSGYLE